MPQLSNVNATQSTAVDNGAFVDGAARSATTAAVFYTLSTKHWRHASNRQQQVTLKRLSRFLSH